MKYISHRGNLTGPDPERENTVDFIFEAIDKGFDCEIDVWYTDTGLFLGHDAPTHAVDIRFLKYDSLWCHAKNAEALEFMLANNIHCFWHENDQRVLTSRGFVWTYPNKQLIDNSVIVVLDKELNHDITSRAVAVCGDYVQSWRR